ncbi:type VI secretion system baseplate subunit TssK [Paraburkholderia sp. BL10I2N1]|uniref:type VI secretion system baseplate subunit TssK n=1 Tax=Paraburkholderia sp. BL10I2N1 TaxID=1938796 RepID=UPI00244340AA|nr:type VI secretion system baseplate subunit TssK [Paraburkholderia sp. BL10I2N1]
MQRADEVFAKARVEDPPKLLDAIIPSRVVSIGPHAQRPDNLDGPSFLTSASPQGPRDWYLSVNAPMPVFELVEQFPRLCKIGAPE